MTTHTSDVTSDRDAIEAISRTLEQWRTLIDELLVQLDLAKLNARSELAHKLQVAQNAYLAAHSKLRDARADSGTNLETLRQGIEQLLRDIAQVYSEVDASIRRGNATE